MSFYMGYCGGGANVITNRSKDGGPIYTTANSCDNEKRAKKRPLEMKEDTVNINYLKENPLKFPYLSTERRLGSGEKYQILGRRVAPTGEIQYLIKWECNN